MRSNRSNVSKLYCWNRWHSDQTTTFNFTLSVVGLNENKVVPTTPSPNKTIIIYRFNNNAVFTHYLNVNLVHMNNTSYAQIYAEHSKECTLHFLGFLLSGGVQYCSHWPLPPPNMICHWSLNQSFCKQCLTKEYITLPSSSWRRNVLFIKEVPLSSFFFFILQWVQRWSKQLTWLKLRATVFGWKNKGFVFLVTILNLWFQLFYGKGTQDLSTSALFGFPVHSHIAYH